MRSRAARPFVLACVSLCALVSACQDTGPDSGGARYSPPTYGYEVVNTYPHDPEAYTQGLYYKGGYLYESTGLLGQSTLRKADLETGKVVKMFHLPDSHFGEGMTIRGDTLYQLTYRNLAAFTYVERDEFVLVDSLPYSLHGWGLTHCGDRLIASDGTSWLTYLEPHTYKETGRFSVTAAGEPQRLLNEMEYIEGRIYANIYGQDLIAVIAPGSGEVEAWLDLRGLRDSIPSGGVLNGIAWDEGGRRLFVTGKNWPAVFEIAVDPLRAETGETP